jgi:lipoprotein-releasing system permease protein
MSLPLFLTRKYLRTKKDSRFLSVISLITIIGIAIGVAVVIIALTVLDGFENVVSEKITSFNSHIKVTGFGSRNLPSQSTVIPELQKQFQNSFTRIQPFVSKLTIIKSKKMTEGITLTGIEAGNNSELGGFIQTGSFNLQNDSGLPKIILGKTLSEKLLIKVGDTVTIFSLKNDQSPSLENPPAIEQFYVNGIYESGMSEYDDLNAFVNFSTAQKMFGMGDLISGYNIKVKDLSRVKYLAEQLQDFLGYPYYVRTIFQVHQNIFTWIELQKEPIPIILGLIIFVAVFNIVGTLLMIVLERTNSVGILRSLGANRKLIMKTFLFHAMYLILIGVLIGNLLALVLTLLQQKFDIISLPDKIYFVTHVPISIELKNYLLVTTVTIAVSLVASMLPAVIATKIKPISAIRFE